MGGMAMRGMASIAWRTLRARPLRTTLTAVGIALGVSVLFASLLTTFALDRSIERAVRADFGLADLRIAAVGERGLSSATIATIRATDGVATVAARVASTGSAASGDTSEVDVRLEPGATAAGVAASLAGRLTTEPYSISTPADAAATLRASTAGFGSTIALVAAVALFAGAFLVFNTLSASAAERDRDVALLRAAGATRRQVVSVVAGAAAMLGAIGSVGGLAIGTIVGAFVEPRIGDVAGIPVDDAGTAPAAVALALAAVAAGAGCYLAILAKLRRVLRLDAFLALRRQKEH